MLLLVVFFFTLFRAHGRLLLLLLSLFVAVARRRNGLECRGQASGRAPAADGAVHDGVATAADLLEQRVGRRVGRPVAVVGVFWFGS